MAAELSGEGLHGLQPRLHHPRAQAFEPRFGLGPVRAGVVDVLEGLAHPAGPGGLEPMPPQAALDLQLEFGQVRLVPGPQVLRPFSAGRSPGPPPCAPCRRLCWRA